MNKATVPFTCQSLVWTDVFLSLSQISRSGISDEKLLDFELYGGKPTKKVKELTVKWLSLGLPLLHSDLKSLNSLFGCHPPALTLLYFVQFSRVSSLIVGFSFLLPGVYHYSPPPGSSLLSLLLDLIYYSKESI